jgi:group I intron endonuclease
LALNSFAINLTKPVKKIGLRYYSSSVTKPYDLDIESKTADVKYEKYYDDAYTMKSQILSENKQKSGIYRFTNKLNGNFYIGSSKDLRVRFYTYYKTNLLSRSLNNTIIAKALLKYGFYNFSIYILEYCDVSVLLEREQYYLDLLKPSYNIAKIAGSNLGVSYSEEVKEKTRQSRLGKIHKEETKNLMSLAHSGMNNSMFGKLHTEQSKSLMSLAKIGKVHDNKTKEAISSANGTAVYLYAACLEDSMNKFCLVKEFLSIRELGKYLNVSHSTVSRYLKSGNLISRRDGKYKISNTLLANCSNS